MKSIAFVCQRYGEEVNGGAELHCRQVAEHLSGEYDVHIYTTCAIDYITWKNEYRPGISVLNGVTVHRFPVIHERQRILQGVMGRWIRSMPFHPDLFEKCWIQAQGPVCDEALDELWNNQDSYTTIFFMTYLYYLTVKGLLRGYKRTCLIPTLHDEWPVYMRIFDDVFRAPESILFNSIEEKQFAIKRFPGIEKKRSDIVGLGIEIPQSVYQTSEKPAIEGTYVVYVGRVDISKGCDELFDFFCRYKDAHPSDLKLVLIGKQNMPVPERKDIISLGFVSETEKFVTMRHSHGLILCSKYESLSMVVLESMLLGIPVLVNGECQVLKGHVERSGGGMAYLNEEEFSLGLSNLLNNEEKYERMSRQGQQYVRLNYQWDEVIKKYHSIIEYRANT